LNAWRLLLASGRTARAKRYAFRSQLAGTSTFFRGEHH
jgi:hypothetical protein